MNERIAKLTDDARLAIGCWLVRIGALIAGKRLYQHSFYEGGAHPSTWTHEVTLTRQALPKREA